MTSNFTPLGSNQEVVSLTGISARGRHGVHEWERRDGQAFVVDVTYRLSRTSTADDLATTVDYGAVAAEVADLIRGGPYYLIETLAGVIADACLARPRVDAVVVTVHKPQVPMPATVADVAVTVARTR